MFESLPSGVELLSVEPLFIELLSVDVLSLGVLSVGVLSVEPLPVPGPGLSGVDVSAEEWTDCGTGSGHLSAGDDFLAGSGGTDQLLEDLLPSGGGH
jgi:hypothetical protein